MIEVIPKHIPKPSEAKINGLNNQYVIVGGIIFIVPTVNYLIQKIEEGDYLPPYIYMHFFEKMQYDLSDQQIIIISTH